MKPGYKGEVLPAGIDFAASLAYSGYGREAGLTGPKFDYDALVKPVEAQMLRSIWRIVRERQSAEDALQDALTIIWKKREAVARHPNPRALILRIAVTQALESLRKSRRRLRHEVHGDKDVEAREPFDPAPNDTLSPELRSAVLEAVHRLPKRQAAAVLLRVIEEQSYKDIALAMGCSEPTVRIHVMRGKAALIRRLAVSPPGRKRGSPRGEKEKRP